MAAGSCRRPQTPPDPGPRRDTRKNPGSAALPWMLCKYPGAHTQLRAPGTLRDQDSSCRAGRPAGALSCLYLSAGCLGVRGAPPAGCALSPCLRRQEQTAGAGSLSPAPRAPGPAPGRQAPPLHAGLQPQGGKLAQWGFGARACSGDEAAAAAPAATTAVFATAAEASHRPTCPKLSRGAPHNRGLEMLPRTGQV